MFSEQERQVYTDPAGRKFDPLRVERTIRLAAGGTPRFNGWLDDLDQLEQLRGKENVPTDDLAKADLAAAQAEESILAAARSALAYDKTTLDAVVLESLWHFLRWLEGKGLPAASGPTSRPATDSPASPNGASRDRSVTSSTLDSS